MSVLFSVGSSGRFVLGGLLLVAAASGGGLAAQDSTTRPPTREAEIRVGLPQDREEASAILGSGEVVLVLPRGAQVPLNLTELGNGLLLGAEVQPGEEGELRLSLRLGGAVVESVEVAGGFLTLRLSQRSHAGPGAVSVAGDDSYRIGVDDMLQISVNEDPELSQRVVVGPSGTVVAPHVGEILANGLTTTELADRLTDRLARDFFVDPRVDVQVVEYRSKWILVSGAVLVPGRITLRGRSDLKQVIADAGGFSEAAGEEIIVARNDPETGASQRIVIVREQFEAGTANIALRHADLVTIPEAEYCHILGEVRVPNQLRVRRGLTLFRALSSAGGLTEWANHKEIQILRADGSVETFDLNKIQKGEADDPAIRGGDRIYVKRRFL